MYHGTKLVRQILGENLADFVSPQVTQVNRQILMVAGFYEVILRSVLACKFLRLIARVASRNSRLNFAEFKL
jgi:hypothetical protein